jgi:hypothetical protein
LTYVASNEKAYVEPILTWSRITGIITGVPEFKAWFTVVEGDRTIFDTGGQVDEG